MSQRESGTTSPPPKDGFNNTHSPRKPFQRQATLSKIYPGDLPSPRRQFLSRQDRSQSNLSVIARRKRTLEGKRGVLHNDNNNIKLTKTKSLSDEEANILKSFDVLPPNRQRTVLATLIQINRPFQIEHSRDEYSNTVVQEVLPILEEAIDLLVSKKCDLSKFKTECCSLIQGCGEEELYLEEVKPSEPVLNAVLASHLDGLSKDEGWKHSTQPSRSAAKIAWETIVALVENHDYSKTKNLVKEHGIDQLMQCVDPSGKNILHLACERNSPILVHSLLKMGANPSAPTKSGETPFLFFMNNFEPGSWSSKRNFLPPIMNRLIDDPDNINFVGKNGDTVLHLLVGVGAYQQVTDALDLGASADIENKNKKVPMDLIFDYIREARNAQLEESSIVHNATNISKCILPNMDASEDQVFRYAKEASILGLKDLFSFLQEHLMEESDVVFFEEDFMDFPANLKGQKKGTIRVLRGGVPSAVLSLLMSPESDKDSMRAFVCGYEKYFSAIELANELLRLSETCDQEKLFLFIEAWMELVPQDLQQKWLKPIVSLFPPSITDHIKNGRKSGQNTPRGSAPFRHFLARVNKLGGSWEVCPMELLKANRYQEADTMLPCLTEDFLNGKIPVSLVAKVLSIWNFTLHKMINTRDVVEYINNQSKYIKKKKEGENVRTAVQAGIDFFSDTCYWAASLVLTAAEEDQVGVMEWLLELAHECVRINNMNTAYAIISCFQITAIFRLKALPKSMCTASQLRLELYQGVFSSQKSYKNYRECMRSAQGKTAVGYLGLLLRDIIYMSDSQPAYLDEGRRLINFSKLRSLYTHIESEHTNFYRSEYDSEFLTTVPSQVVELLKDLAQMNKVTDMDLLTNYSKWKIPSPPTGLMKRRQSKISQQSISASKQKEWVKPPQSTPVFPPVGHEKEGGVTILAALTEQPPPQVVPQQSFDINAFLPEKGEKPKREPLLLSMGQDSDLFKGAAGEREEKKEIQGTFAVDPNVEPVKPKRVKKRESGPEDLSKSTGWQFPKEKEREG